jgi:restriction endonuclease Mrr
VQWSQIRVISVGVHTDTFGGLNVADACLVQGAAFAERARQLLRAVLLTETQPKAVLASSVTHGRSRDADAYVSKIGSKIVLIDGSRLAELMIEFGVAVATDATYTVKRIDNDFFESI